MSKTITSRELSKLLKEKQEIVIVDVRRKADYEADKEMIPGAFWRDPERVDEWSKHLPAQKQVVIYCVRGGSVSQSVSKRLEDAKVKASYIEGGLAAWKQEGGDIEQK
jgi:rhodanese-related sulfurtransferase